MRGPTPWPAPGESHVHGPLSTDRVDEYVSRVFRPPDPVAKEIELRLERIRQDQDRYRLARAVEELVRDRADLEELAGQLKRLREPQPQPQPEPQPQPRSRGRRSERGDNKELLRELRDKHGGDCRGEFCAEFTRRRESRKKVSFERAARVYNTADGDLKAETSK
jgi:hypothetical protein